MLQKAEHANLLAAMEAEAAEQTRKINRLTVQMVEREIISNKNAQRVT